MAKILTGKRKQYSQIILYLTKQLCIKVRHLLKKLTFVHMGLIEQLQYLIYDYEVYFCVQNYVKPESLFQ